MTITSDDRCGQPLIAYPGCACVATHVVATPDVLCRGWRCACGAVHPVWCWFGAGVDVKQALDLSVLAEAGLFRDDYAACFAQVRPCGRVRISLLTAAVSVPWGSGGGCRRVNGERMLTRFRVKGRWCG